MSACIVVDIGNTSTSIGRYEDGAVSCIRAVRGGMASRPENVDAALREAGADDAERAVLASVVPAATPHWIWLLRRLFSLETLVLTHETPLPIGIRYPRPETIGADRLADACGAAARHGAPAIVADFGTALTFDVLSRDREYLGGVIAPGLPLMTGYLHEKTAKLPEIDLQGDIEPIGTSTENAMRIGALVGHRGMVREVTRYLQETTGPGAVLCATGLGALCGNWWTNPVAGDGTPLGYQVFEGEGRNITNRYYKSTGYPATYQFKLYGPGNSLDRPKAVVAKVWNWDETWRVRWYEDGKLMGDMEQFYSYDPDYLAYVNGARVVDDYMPFRHNRFFSAYPSENAKEVKVEVTDHFGTTYTETLKLR